MDRSAIMHETHNFVSSTYKEDRLLIEDFLERTAAEFGFGYGIQEIKGIATRLKTHGDVFANSLLSDPEYSLYCGLKIDKRRSEWLAGRIAAKKAYFQHSDTSFANLESSQVSVLYQPSRAPYLVNYPDLNVSISHSHDYSVAVIASSNIGIDIEKIEPRPPSLARRFFSKAEYDHLEDVCFSSSDIDVQITRFWSRKEAVSKHLQLGGSLDFRLLDTSQDVLNVDHKSNLPVRLISGRCDGYWISLAVSV